MFINLYSFDDVSLDTPDAFIFDWKTKIETEFTRVLFFEESETYIDVTNCHSLAQQETREIELSSLL